MIRNGYRERWAQWLPSALSALAKSPPDYAAVMPQMPIPARSNAAIVRPPDDLRVSLISSSGAYDSRFQAPFAAASIVGDPTHRVLGVDTPSDLIEFAHEHFNRAAARSDIECVIPRRALRSCDVGLSPHLISWTGFLLDWPTFIEATIPQIVKQVHSDGSNAALIVPI